MLTFVKPAILSFVVANMEGDFGVMLSDLDVIWYKNIIPCANALAEEHGIAYPNLEKGEARTDAYMLCSAEPYFQNALSRPVGWSFCNAGLLFAKHSSAPLLQKWVQAAQSLTATPIGDQDP